MDIKNLFKHGKKISKYAFSKNYLKSKTTQGFLENKKIAEILNRRAEKSELNQAMYEKKEGGLTKEEMKETIGELKTLSEKERRDFAKVMFPSTPSGQRFIKPKKETKAVAPADFSTRKNISPVNENPQTTPVKIALITNRLRKTSTTDSSENNENKQSKESFSSAIAATMKNKRNENR